MKGEHMQRAKNAQADEIRALKRMKDRERGVPGGIYISCSACEFFEKL